MLRQVRVPILNNKQRRAIERTGIAKHQKSLPIGRNVEHAQPRREITEIGLLHINCVETGTAIPKKSLRLAPRAYTLHSFGPDRRRMESEGEAGMRLIFLCVSLILWHSFLQDPQKAVEEKPVAAAAAPTADAGKLVNPTKPTPASLAAGKKSYGTDCAMCHGKTGAGDGDLAGDMKLQLRDYRNPDSLKSMSDGEIFTIIDKGKGQMSGEEGRMSSAQIWNVVNYVRALSKK